MSDDTEILSEQYPLPSLEDVVVQLRAMKANCLGTQEFEAAMKWEMMARAVEKLERPSVATELACNHKVDMEGVEKKMDSAGQTSKVRAEIIEQELRDSNDRLGKGEV